ncbi:MAG: hypothetical protein HZT40_18485 [Candidatus Thiothrix singaporensis]|uniref:Uncharacterized protein n=1 Tax=Candidatus Thiothrix singaporensis TaxID=2799669 RepID=A0A7L6AVW0_9GAMM|nr:MAG: hypothetical protein HZT40_18485 [Candidatus Thiothrix singaporensis]
MIYRSSESQIFVERYTPDFGSSLPEPKISSRGGTVGYPLTLEQMQNLSNTTLIRYCKHYEGYGDMDDSHPADYLRGGQGQVQHLLSEATAYDPERYLKLIPCSYPVNWMSDMLKILFMALPVISAIVLAMSSQLRENSSGKSPK